MTEVKGTYRDWWQYPRRYGEDPGQRRVTYLELFYDLIYVVIIAELSHSLSLHLNIEGLLEFVFLFYLVWFAWINGSLYHDIHGNNDVRTRVFTFLQMITVASMALFAHNAWDEGAPGFGLSYAGFLLILTFLWWRSGIHDPDHKVASQPYSAGFLIITLLFVLSAFVSDPINIYLWIVGALIGLALPIIIIPRARQTSEYRGERPQMFSHSGIERFGLFTIIVLGEVIVGVVSGIAEVEDISWYVAFTALLGLIIGFGLWWIYFDLIANNLPKQDPTKEMIWMLCHLPLTMSITAIGATILNVVEQGNETIPDQLFWIFIGSVCVFVLSILFLVQVVQIPEGYEAMYGRVNYILTLSVILIFVTGFFDMALVPSLAIIVVLIIIPIVYGLKIWIQTIRSGNLTPNINETE